MVGFGVYVERCDWRKGVKVREGGVGPMRMKIVASLRGTGCRGSSWKSWFSYESRFWVWTEWGLLTCSDSTLCNVISPLMNTWKLMIFVFIYSFNT